MREERNRDTSTQEMRQDRLFWDYGSGTGQLRGVLGMYYLQSGGIPAITGGDDE